MVNIAGFLVGMGLWGVVLGYSAQAVPSQSNPGLLCPQQLGLTLDAIANQSQFQQGRWGLLIQPLGNSSGSPLYAREHQKLFLTASTIKLLTTAVVLETLGPQFQIQTDFMGLGATPTLERLRVIGRGDPSLTDAQLIDVAQQLQKQGVRHIQQLVGDDSAFQGSAVVPTWEWEDLQAGYGAPVNSLILNQNQIILNLWPQDLGQPLKVEWVSPQPADAWEILNRSRTVIASDPESVDVMRNLNGSILEISGQLRVGSEPAAIDVAVPNPGWYFLKRFREILATHNITVGQLTLLSEESIKTGQNPSHPAERLITSIQSPPLSELIAEVNQVSNNLYAEALLRVLATAKTIDNPSTDNALTLTQGLEHLTQTLTQWDVDASGYVLFDGSGLSRQSGVSPETLVQVLMHMAQAKHAPIYRSSLAIPGGKGTLRRRFVNPPVQGRLQAKSGTMRGVVALAGYLESPHYSPLVFSIVVNQANQSIRQLRGAIDEMVQVLGRLRSCQ